MPVITEELKPIVDVFAETIKDPRAITVLQNWQEAINTGLFNFGRKETLNDELEFNTLFFMHPNPAFNRSLNRIVLNVEIEIAGVVTNRRFEHPKFNYLRNEMLIVKAAGRWDYEKNNRFRHLRVQDSLTLCIPENVDSNVAANAGLYTNDISKQCTLWLLTHRAGETAKTHKPAAKKTKAKTKAKAPKARKAKKAH